MSCPSHAITFWPLRCTYVVDTHVSMKFVLISARCHVVSRCTTLVPCYSHTGHAWQVILASLITLSTLSCAVPRCASLSPRNILVWVLGWQVTADWFWLTIAHVLTRFRCVSVTLYYVMLRYSYVGDDTLLLRHCMLRKTYLNFEHVQNSGTLKKSSLRPASFDLVRATLSYVAATL